MRMRIDGEASEGVTAIAQNSDPFTYFGRLPVRVCEGAALDNGTLSVAMLRRAAQRDVPTVAFRVLSERVRIPDHRQIDHFAGVTEARIESTSLDADGRIRPFPVQVDGDYIGGHGELDLGIDHGALTIVA
jgi:diacylglycerol kinase family enzyme